MVATYSTTINNNFASAVKSPRRRELPPWPSVVDASFAIALCCITVGKSFSELVPNTISLSLDTVTMNNRLLLALALISSCQAFSSPNHNQHHSEATTRADFLQHVGAVTAAAWATPAWAAGSSDPSLKGTKKDPAYEACVSKCMYECTKPKVEEQKTRQECLPECKKKCATTKEQLLLGTPKSS